MCMEERLQGNPVSEGIAYAKSYIYIPGTLTKAPEFFPKGQENLYTFRLSHFHL